MLCFGIANCLWIFPLKDMTNTKIILVRSFLTTIFFGILLLINLQFEIPFLGKIPDNLKIINFVYVILICAFSYFGLFFFSLSLKETKVSLAVPVSSIGAIFGIITAIVVYNESFSVNKIFSGLMFFIGLMFINESAINQKFKLSKGIIYNLLAAFFWGISFSLFRLCVNWLGATLFSFVLEITVFLMSIITFKFFNPNDTFLNFKNVSVTSFKFVMLLAILVFIGVLSNSLAFYLLPVNEMSLLGVFTEVISIIFAFLVLKEKITLNQKVGILIMIAGLTFMQI